MSIQHAIWTVSGIPKPLIVGRLLDEHLLEDMIIRDPRILSTERYTVERLKTRFTKWNS